MLTAGTPSDPGHVVGSGLAAVLDALHCPVCASALSAMSSGLRCGQGHAFDVARQGYVNLAAGLGRAALGADDPGAVAARAEFLSDGHFSPVVERLVAIAAESWPGRGLVLDAGAGTGDYLAAVLDRLPEAHGLAVDASAAALRRAARAHPRAAAVGWDLREPLPVRDDVCGLVLVVFAPRNGLEYARVLRPDGALLVVTPGPGHLGELIGPLGLIRVDADKPARVAAALQPHFTLVGTAGIRVGLRLAHDAVRALVRMGPSAHHVDPDLLAARLRAVPDPAEVTVEVNLGRYAPA